MIYVNGQKKLAKALSPIPLEEFLPQFNAVYGSVNRISGSALFFARDFRRLPRYISRIMFTNNIVYDDNIIVSIIRTEQPFGVTWGVTREITPGLSIFEIYLGYMEIVDIGKILREAEIDEKTIFYGMEDIITTNVIWRIFAAHQAPFTLRPAVLQAALGQDPWRRDPGGDVTGDPGPGRNGSRRYCSYRTRTNIPDTRGVNRPGLRFRVRVQGDGTGTGYLNAGRGLPSQVKGDGFRVRSRRGPQVRILLHASVFCPVQGRSVPHSSAIDSFSCDSGIRKA